MRRFFLILIPLLFVLVVFRKFFFAGFVPIPADIMTGGYYPWADDTWGYPVKVPIKNSLPSDVVSLLYPWRILGIDIFKSGHLPLWDPTILLGVPLLANFQSSLFNPLNFLFLIFNNVFAWSIQVILQPQLAIFAMYLFLRNLKFSHLASVFAGLLYAFSGYSIVWLEYNSIIYTTALFPLLLLLIDKLVIRPTARIAFLLSLLLCFQFFAGYPLTASLSLFFGGLYYLYRAQNVASVKRTLLPLCVGVFSGLLLASVQLLPGLELSEHSVRSFDKSALAADIKYLPFGHLLSFFIPDFFGNPGTGNYWSLGSYDNFAFFISAVGVYFFLLSLAGRWAFKREQLIFTVFILLSLIWATPNFLSRTFPDLFLGFGSAVNTRILFVVCFSASILAACSFERVFLKKEGTLIEKSIPLAVIGGIVAGTLLANLQTVDLERELGILNQSFTHPTKEFIDAHALAVEEIGLTLAHFKIALRNSVIPLGIFIICFLLAVVKIRILAILILFPLLLYSIKVSTDKYLSFTRADLVFPRTPALEKMRELVGINRFEKEKAEIYPANSWSAFKINSPSGQDVLAPLAYARYITILNTGSLNDELITRYIQAENPNSPLYKTLNITHFAALDRHEKESIPHKEGRPFPWKIPGKFRDVSNIDTVRLFENTDNLGFAWFNKETKCIKNYQDSYSVLSDPQYDPSEVMIVNCHDPKRVGDLGKITDIEVGPNKVSFLTSTVQDNYLTVSQNAFPGWEASIDGGKTPLLLANTTLVGLYVPQGEHQVELFYKPRSVYYGGALSLGTIILWGIYFLTRYAKTKQKRD